MQHLYTPVQMPTGVPPALTKAKKQKSATKRVQSATKKSKLLFKHLAGTSKKQEKPLKQIDNTFQTRQLMESPKSPATFDSPSKKHQESVHLQLQRIEVHNENSIVSPMQDELIQLSQSSRARSQELARRRKQEIREREEELARLAQQITFNRLERASRLNKPARPLQEAPTTNVYEVPARSARQGLVENLMNMVLETSEQNGVSVHQTSLDHYRSIE